MIWGIASLILGVASVEIPEAWRTVTDGHSAAVACHLYTNGAPRCVWAGDLPGVEDTMPACVPFHFAITGSKESVSNVQHIIDRTCEAIPDRLRLTLKACKLLNPTMQWLVRWNRHSVTNQHGYLWRKGNHTATYKELDFNLTNLTEMAKQLTAKNIPAVAAVSMEDEMFRTLPTVPTIAGVDYPGDMPEVTYKTPFGVGIVLRAPQCGRSFRFRASAWPINSGKVNFQWAVIGGGVWVTPWMPGKHQGIGYGLIHVNRQGIKANGRTDVLVFARYGNGPWGAPSIISFYNSPYEIRSYNKAKEVEKIQYIPAPKKLPPYDISSICLPAEWTDYYQYDGEHHILGFKRVTPLTPIGEEFSYLGEKVLEQHPNDTPKTAMKVRYFAKDGQLHFEETGEQINYRPDAYKPRNRAD